MLKNKLFKKIMYSNLKFFILNNILINTSNIIEIQKYMKGNCKILYFKSKKFLKKCTYHLNLQKLTLLLLIRKNKSSKEKILLTNSCININSKLLHLNILVLNDDISLESNDLLGFNSFFFIKKTYIQNGLMFCYVVHKWHNFNTSIIITPAIIFKSSLDLTALKVISNFIKYISITSIIFFKKCYNLTNLDSSLTNIKIYLEKFISYHLVKNNMILVIPLCHSMKFTECLLRDNASLKNIYEQFKHVRFLTGVKQETLWNNWIDIYYQIILSKNKKYDKRVQISPLFDLKIPKKINSIVINTLLMIFIEICIDFIIKIDDNKLMRIIRQLEVY
ncbi:hypothetical protein M951_chr393 (nucleomorph) [Lotharella oceanica]|uniref:Uncharacterized protein n=1 Tax=Lotharella oceanica TaxID=641309 RepID=A0A060DBA3_9EUKA|nr:hypothetical protein M951_chr393 [Lotharella oceanica]